MNAKAKTSTKQNTKETAKVTTAVATKENAFAGASDFLSAGIDALFENQGAGQYSLIPLDEIKVKAQIRETFEDEENTLEDLAASIKARGVLQPVLLRPNIKAQGYTDGYELIAGERRYRASKLAGLDLIPAYIREMSDDEAEDAQMAENIHRKNLTQIEEAKKIQRDLDKLGSVEAVLEKHQKSRPWLSKMLGLLNLPEQAKRLVAENVSADVEVINTVKTIEKIDPAKAKELVDDLKSSRGKGNARDKAAAVKEEVKPSKKAKEAKEVKTPKWLEEQRKRDAERAEQGGTVATAKDQSHKEPGEVQLLVDSKAIAEILGSAYANIFEFGGDPMTILDVMATNDKDSVEAWLQSFYDAGVKAHDAGRAVIQGFRNGQFATDGHGAFALVAFLQGADSEAKFNLLNVFGCMKS